jgi:3-methyladenine DNA glycosylase AlkD
MNLKEIIDLLKSLKNKDSVKGMVRYGINPKNNLGISIYELRKIAKKIGKNHDLAIELWNSEIHDARLLACFIDNPKEITSLQMDSWAKDFDSWDICDQACTSLFDLSPLSWIKVFEWANRSEEFVKRGAFSLIAGLAVHDKDAIDKKFEKFFPIIKKHSTDERNFVKKGVNWALRNVGKRNLNLNRKAIEVSNDILKIDSKTARWIARDAIKELTNIKIQKKLKKKN